MMRSLRLPAAIIHPFQCKTSLVQERAELSDQITRRSMPPPILSVRLLKPQRDLVPAHKSVRPRILKQYVLRKTRQKCEDAVFGIGSKVCAVPPKLFHPNPRVRFGFNHNE